MEISWQRENGGEDKERESNGKMGHGRWQKAAQNPNPNQLFPQGTTSFPNGSKSAAPSCTAALCWRGTGQGQERNTKGTPVSPQFPRVGTVGTRDGRAKRGARRGGEGANKEASHGSRLRSFLRISTTDHSDARSGFSPTRETRCLLHLCLGQEAQPIGSWLRRNESSWPPTACPGPKIHLSRPVSPQLGMWPYHPPQSSSSLFSRVWKSACWS